MSSRSNPLGGVLVLAGLAAIALVNWGTGGHFFTVVAIALAAYVVFRVARKVRRTRRRSEATSARMRAGEMHVEGTPPGRSQSALHGRLQGIRDGKHAKAMAARLGPEPAMIFSVEAGADQRWIGGYREGIAEILPKAVVEVDYQAQHGSTVV